MARNRGLPHGGARRSRRAVRGLRPHAASPTTPAATATAQSARARRARNGSPRAQAELLPVPYFHVVFTLPPPAAEIAFQNKADGLRPAVCARRPQALTRTRRQSTRLGAKIGLIAVLHTWGQTLTHHPHVHCVVPGGGVALDGERWVACTAELPALRPRAVEDLPPAVPRRPRSGLPARRTRLLRRSGPARRGRAPSPNACARCAKVAFVVYAKPPFGGPERVLAYLARYTHRTAIANSRLVALDDDEVAFSYKDYRRGGRSRVMRLAPHEFIRRFLLHVLPDGFHRIRHYGFLAKGERRQNLARIRELLQVQPAHEPDREAEAPTNSEPDADAASRAVRCLPGLRRLHAPHRARRRIANRRLSLRHIMTTNLGPTSIAFVFQHRRASRRRR